MRSLLNRRAAAVVAASILLGGAVAGCTGRYWQPTPDGRISPAIQGAERGNPFSTVLTSPTVLGWLLPGRAVRVDAWGLDDGGRTLLLAAIRGEGDLVTSARIISRSDDRLVVAVTVTDPFLWIMRTAVGLPFVVRVPLDPPIDPAAQLVVVDGGFGQETPVSIRFDVAQ